MSLYRLAYSNFKRSVREYGILILSLAFSVFIFFNFQNVIYSDSMDVLKDFNRERINVVVQAASVVFGVFLFFFVWYATNVFLNQRKKEIGIYIFMGLDNSRIGKMYVIEATCVGLAALFSGMMTGIIFSKLFQMMLLKLSDISANVRFSLSVRPIGITACFFAVVYGLMILKGYYTLKTSSVLNLLSGAKQKEMRPEKKFITIGRILVGAACLAAGYYAAYTTGDITSLKKIIYAVIFVIVGIYFLYSGLIPAILRAFTNNKIFLYQKERNLWINSLAFRMKKNYRTYAMVTILMIASVTVLALSIAMKNRYDNMLHFDQTYTYQILSSHEYDGESIADGISKENEVEYWNQFKITIMDASLFETTTGQFSQEAHAIIAFSAVKEAAKKAGLAFPYDKLEKDQIIDLEHQILMSLAETDVSGEKIQINGEEYTLLCDDMTPFLGKMQNYVSSYIVSDETYETLKGLGTETYCYNYRIKDIENMDASKPFLNRLSEEEEEGSFTGINYTQMEKRDDSWICVMYSLCIFMFVTLVLAAGSILFLKIGNDAYEDRERYQVLKKLGIPKRALRSSVCNEICFMYACPFILMAITSFFSVKALGNVMKENMFSVNLWSAGMILVVFIIICFASVKAAQKQLSL